MVQFKDFWTLNEWGMSKELVYRAGGHLVERNKILGKEWFIVLHEVDKGIEQASALSGRYDLDITYTADVETTIWLGRIKIGARQLAFLT